MIHRGTTCDIYIGYRAGQRVAIKHYHHAGSDIPYFVLREINVMRLLDHPNLVKLLGVEEIEGNLALIMEFGGSENLCYVSTTWTSEQRIRLIPTITRQLIAGLRHMHSRGILHRDLKPENILWSADDQHVRICDFNLSKKVIRTRRSADTWRVCAASYRPPELFGNSHFPHHPSIDIWSLGCVLFELMTGSMLFSPADETSEIGVLQSILRHIPATPEDLRAIGLSEWKQSDPYTPIIWPPNTNPDLQDLVSRMLAINPNRRITLAEAAVHPFVNPTRSALWQKSRLASIEHLVCVAHDHHLSENTIESTIKMLDRLDLSHTDTIPLHVSVCLLLASKYYDAEPLEAEDLGLPISTISEQEKKILHLLDYNLEFLSDFDTIL